MGSLLQAESSDLESLPGTGISEDGWYLPGKFHVREGEAPGAGRQSRKSGIPRGQCRGQDAWLCSTVARCPPWPAGLLLAV